MVSSSADGKEIVVQDRRRPNRFRCRATRMAQILFFVALILPALATADESAESAGSEEQNEDTPEASTILEGADRALAVAEDFTATIELTTTTASGRTEERTMTVSQKGQHQRLVQLTGPARLRGVGLLAKDEGQLYIYLPSFDRVRRVAGQQRGEPFLGSNFTQDDFSRTKFSHRFDPTLVDANDEYWTLQLTPKVADDEPYEKLILKVRTKDHQVPEILFFEDGSEEPTRRLTASDFRVKDSQSLAHQIVVEDLKDDSRSVAKLSEVEVNTGMSDSRFTRRHLQR